MERNGHGLAVAEHPASAVGESREGALGRMGLAAVAPHLRAFSLDHPIGPQLDGGDQTGRAQQPHGRPRSGHSPRDQRFPSCGRPHQQNHHQHHKRNHPGRRSCHQK